MTSYRVYEQKSFQFGGEGGTSLRHFLLDVYLSILYKYVIRTWVEVILVRKSREIGVTEIGYRRYTVLARYI